jgi:Site-specific recombinases, DNA invertase Pin homologs
MARTSRKGGVAAVQTVPTDRIWQTALYARLSVEDSGRKGADSIDTQVELIQGYINEQPNMNTAGIYSDNGESGKNFDRPEWQRLMDDLRSGRIDCICVKDLSRFSRDYIETIEFLEKIFPFMGVRFISINDGYDSKTADSGSDGLIIALKSLVNDHYLRDISRKILSAGDAKRARGEQMSGFAPYGYIMSDSQKGRLIPDEETAPVVRQIFDWRSEGIGLQAICKRLDYMGIPSPRERQKMKYGVKNTGGHESSLWLPKTITRIVSSKVYLGHMEMGKTRQALCERKPVEIISQDKWELVFNTHEPLVSEDLWEEVRRLTMERRQRFYDMNADVPAKPENIFKGFLVCGACGAKLTRRRDKWDLLGGGYNETYRFGCHHAHKHSDDQQYPSVRLEKLQDTVFPVIAKRLKLVTNYAAIIEKRAKSRQNPRAALDAEIAASSRELEKKNEQLVRLYDNYAVKDVNEREYLQIKAQYEREMDSLRERLNDLARRAALMGDTFDSDNRWLKASQDFISPKTLTREMLEALVDRIIVSGPDNINITWKFEDDYAHLKSCSKEEAV